MCVDTLIEYCLDEHHHHSHHSNHHDGISWSLVVVCDENDGDEMNDVAGVYTDRYKDSLLNGISVIPVTRKSCPGMLRALCGGPAHVVVIFNGTPEDNCIHSEDDDSSQNKHRMCYRNVAESMCEENTGAGGGCCCVVDAGRMDAVDILGAISRIVNDKAITENIDQSNFIVVGVVASWKRLVQLHRKGCIPLGWGRRQSQEDVRFVPLCIHNDADSNISKAPNSVALGSVDALLIKYSDFIETIDWSSHNKGGSVVFSKALTNLVDAASRSDTVPSSGKGVLLIDGINSSMDCVLDRVAMYKMIDEIARVARKTLAMPVRSAVWSVLDDGIHHPVEIPCLLKPRAACGVEYAHQMALVLKKEGVEDCELEYPLVAQEYINHSGVLFKVYVAGTHVLVEQKQSMPDIPHETNDDIPSCIEFDSLHGLPKRLPWISADYGHPSSGHVRRPSFSILNDRFLQQLADVVRQHVTFSVFGFDVVFDHQAGEAIIVDLNYFPSFGGLGRRDEEQQAGVSLERVMMDAMLTSCQCIN